MDFLIFSTFFSFWCRHTIVLTQCVNFEWNSFILVAAFKLIVLLLLIAYLLIWCFIQHTAYQCVLYLEASWTFTSDTWRVQRRRRISNECIFHAHQYQKWDGPIRYWMGAHKIWSCKCVSWRLKIYLFNWINEKRMRISMGSEYSELKP